MKKEKTFIYMYSLMITATTFNVTVDEYEIDKMNSTEILLTNGQKVSNWSVIGRMCGQPIDVQDYIAEKLISTNKNYIYNNSSERYGVFSTIKYNETIIAQELLNTFKKSLEKHKENINFQNKCIENAKAELERTVNDCKKYIESTNKEIKSLSNIVNLIKSKLSPTKAK